MLLVTRRQSIPPPLSGGSPWCETLLSPQQQLSIGHHAAHDPQVPRGSASSLLPRTAPRKGLAQFWKILGNIRDCEALRKLSVCASCHASQEGWEGLLCPVGFTDPAPSLPPLPSLTLDRCSWLHHRGQTDHPYLCCLPSMVWPHIAVQKYLCSLPA